MLTTVTVGASADAKQPWTLRDSIELTYFASATGGYGRDNVTGAAAIVSPDQKRFFIITRRGDLARDCNIYRLDVYETNLVRGALVANSSKHVSAARTLEVCSKDAFEPGISRARWTDGSTAIVFLRADDSQTRGVQLWDLRSSISTELTPRELVVESFDFRGGTLLYVATSPSAQQDTPRYPATYMRNRDWSAAFGFKQLTYTTFIRTRDGSTRRIGSAQVGFDWRRFGSLSPDGNAAVLAVPLQPSQVPQTWRAYANSRGHPAMEFVQYRIVDVRNGRDWPAVDAPLGHAIDNQSAPQVLWVSADRAILINTLLPLDDTRERRRRTSYIVDYDLQRKAWRVVAAMPSGLMEQFRGGSAPIMSARWLRPGTEFLIAGMASTRAYRFHHNKWVEQSMTAPEPEDRSPEADGVQLQIRQGVNNPPQLIASGAQSELVLSRHDPVTGRARTLPTEIVEWRDRDNGVWKGLLVLPPVEHRKALLPLIMQADAQIYTDLFFPDGALTPGFAAQAMAARGFAVLTFGTDGPGHDRTGPQEGLRFIAGVDAAVAHLEKKSSIDPSRVGLIGYSRSGYLVNYALTHTSVTKLAAAIVQDSFDASYIQYLAGSVFVSTGRRQQYEDQYENSGPFWANKPAWISDAPGFNADKIDTPLLLTNHGGFPGGLLSMLETYAALQMNNRPIDIRVLPGATHPLLRPGHRLAAMEAAIDWMCFWLRQQEDADPAKVDQYSHWRMLREKWQVESTRQ